MKKGPRNSRTKSLLACAVSSDGSILAVGGGDRSVHIWDVKTQKLIQSFPGHKDIVTGKFSLQFVSDYLITLFLYPNSPKFQFLFLLQV